MQTRYLESYIPETHLLLLISNPNRPKKKWSYTDLYSIRSRITFSHKESFYDNLLLHAANPHISIYNLAKYTSEK